MAYIQLLNMIVAMLITIHFQYSLYIRRLIFLKSVIKTSPEVEKAILYDEINVKSERMGEIMFLIFLEAIILTIGFITLFVIQTSFSKVVFFASGIHVPVFLMLLGMIIRTLYNHHTKKRGTIPLEFKELEKITLLISLIIDVSLSFINWTLGLFILSLIIGKYVWIDFALGSGAIIGKIKAVRSYFIQSDVWDVVFYCKKYAINYLAFFGVFSFFCYCVKDMYNNFSLFFQWLLCVYISVFFICKSMIGGTDIGDGATKFALGEKEKKK